jgi:cell fate (sporulation/competence/biofilm development) regulator YlbF (YheA/YmcA/DUF963 family)
LCKQLKEVPGEEDDKDETEVAVQQAKPTVTRIDIVNEFASKRKSLSVQIGELGPDFCEAGVQEYR